MTDSLKLKYGTAAQMSGVEYNAGTMYLSEKGTGIADLYFDMGGTRLEITPTVLEDDLVESLVDQVTLQYRSKVLNDNQINDMVDDIWAGV